VTEKYEKVIRIFIQNKIWSGLPNLKWYDIISAYAQVYNTRSVSYAAQSEKRRHSLATNVMQPDLFVRYFG
jgi:hypothetical protein